MIRTLLILVALYAFAALGLTLFQRSFLYPAPSGSGGVPSGFEVSEYPTDDGLTLRAGYRAAAKGKPTIVYFHGNGADWQSSVVATDRLVPQGYGVLAAEYRGYASNPGSPSEEGLYADGRAALAWLDERGLSPKDIVIIGNSIGSGVAVQMAQEVQPAALVLISPFNSLEQLAGEKVWWLPTSLLLRDRYRNDLKLGTIETPILILHGEADTMIPAAHGRQLAAANPRTVLQTFPRAGHELAWLDPAEQRTLEFLDEVLAR
ncbi:alpha/beta hydrolase [Parerythrobacter aestuarii]|uniref:alpha/beta hydrolase n=1 Tax=Parerythrobacter aestuarii TaxID=3020909 RepID=UPI0024DE57B3|nr:alpha/beta fold hydrolase [Parerythrobacter aestuarii]